MREDLGRWEIGSGWVRLCQSGLGFAVIGTVAHTLWLMLKLKKLLASNP